MFWRAYSAVDRWLVDINVGLDIMERLLENIYINARPAMDFKLRLTSSALENCERLWAGRDLGVLPSVV